MFSTIARFLGASVKGQLLYFGERMYDFPLVSVARRTVVDGATVVGHNIIYGKTHFGHTHISGTVRQKTFVMAMAKIYGKETGPWHAIAQPVISPSRHLENQKPTVTRLPSGGTLDGKCRIAFVLAIFVSFLRGTNLVS